MPNSDELSPEEIDEIRNALAREEVPADLHARVVDTLKNRGLLTLRPGSRSDERVWMKWAGAAAITVIAFFGGLLFAGRTGESRAFESATDDRGTYVLLLRESNESAPDSPEEVERLVAEYGAWAREKAGEGKIVGGEKLDVGGLRISGETGEPEEWTAEEGFLGGFFLVKASSYAEAAEIASSCPHLRHGGTIEIRRIETVDRPRPAYGAAAGRNVYDRAGRLREVSRSGQHVRHQLTHAKDFRGDIVLKLRTARFLRA